MVYDKLLRKRSPLYVWLASDKGLVGLDRIGSRVTRYGDSRTKIHPRQERCDAECGVLHFNGISFLEVSAKNNLVHVGAGATHKSCK